MSRRPEAARFGEYFCLRAQGLRRPALAALRTFVDEALGWDEETRRRFVEAYCEAVCGPVFRKH